MHLCEELTDLPIVGGPFGVESGIAVGEASGHGLARAILVVHCQ